MTRGEKGKPHIWSKEDIEELSSGKYSRKEFAEKHGTHYCVVKKLIQKYNIQEIGSLKPAKVYTTRDLEMLAGTEYSISELAEIFEVTEASIYSIMTYHSIRNMRCSRRKSKKDLEDIKKLILENKSHSYIAKKLNFSLESITRCGKKMGVSRKNSKLVWTKQEAEEVMKLKTEGWTTEQLRNKFKCSANSIHKIRRGTMKLKGE